MRSNDEVTRKDEICQEDRPSIGDRASDQDMYPSENGGAYMDKKAYYVKI